MSEPNEMVDRVARAIWADRAARIKAQDSYSRCLQTKSRGDWTFDELESPMKAALASEAIAAIAAMREPTEEMVEAMLKLPPRTTLSLNERIAELWRAGIDRALTGSPRRS